MLMFESEKENAAYSGLKKKGGLLTHPTKKVKGKWRGEAESSSNVTQSVSFYEIFSLWQGGVC